MSLPKLFWNYFCISGLRWLNFMSPVLSNCSKSRLGLVMAVFFSRTRSSTNSLMVWSFQFWIY